MKTGYIGLILGAILLVGACDNSDKLALGQASYDGKNYDEARGYLEPLSKSGDKVAQYLLSTMYVDGLGGLNIDEQQALVWVKKSAEQNYGPALDVLFEYYEDLDEYETVYNLAKKAANQGVTEAMMQMSYMYKWGDFVDQSPTEAAAWELKAAEAGNVLAQFSIANNGFYRPVSVMTNAEMLEWYTKAANQGHIEAQKTLGSIYLVGSRGVTVDKELGLSWMSKAAAQGDKSAAIILHKYKNK